MEQPIEVLIRQAVDLFYQGQFAKAEKKFKKILELHPNHPLVIGSLGDFYLQTGQVNLALPLLRRLVAIQGDDYNAHFLLGVAYAKVGRFWHSQNELEKADALKPNDPEITRQMGWGQGLAGEIETGRTLLKKSIALESHSPIAYADLGASYMFTGEYDEAEVWLKKSLSIDPEYRLARQLWEDLKTNRATLAKLSSVEQEKERKKLQSPEYHKQMRIDLMMNGLSQMKETSEDLAEVMLEFKKMGLSGQITMFHDPHTPEGKAAIEYVERHPKIKNLDRQKLTAAKVHQLANRLLSNKTALEEKKDIILTLAHQGSLEALKVLEKYAEKPDDELMTWARMALDECKSFLSGAILDEPVVQIHRMGEDKKKR